MSDVYHEGEIEIQKRTGVWEEADRKKGTIRSYIPAVAQEYLSNQRMVIAASIDKDQDVWVSALLGDRGFMKALDDETIAIHAHYGHSATAAHLRMNPMLGLLVIELHSRRRMRVNGTGNVLPDGSILVHTEQVYSNCPKYIQARGMPEFSRQSWIQGEQEHAGTSVLTAEQMDWIRCADTFFIGSFHPASGADASHRGGNPGFVDVVDAGVIRFPDYKGNAMFNTIGNLAHNSKCGLLFLDFERGRTLQLTGAAEILWEDIWLGRYPGAERAIEFRVEKAVQTDNVLPQHWEYESSSPFNPG